MGRSGRVSGTREVLVNGYPYILSYRLDHEAGELSIVSVVHMARRRP
jgi:plasmid stabilization system protein ParE